MSSPATLDYGSHPPSRGQIVVSRTRSAIKGLLLAFVLVSIGFALGKEVTLRSLRAAQAGGVTPSPSTQPTTAPAADKVIVYYLHATIRCVTCNKIEKMARELVEQEFTPELRAGRVEWRTGNFDKDESLVTRYDIFSSSLVLVRAQGSRELGHQRLDDAWQLSDNPAAFRDYVRSALKKTLRGGHP